MTKLCSTASRTCCERPPCAQYKSCLWGSIHIGFPCLSFDFVLKYYAECQRGIASPRTLHMTYDEVDVRGDQDNAFLRLLPELCKGTRAVAPIQATDRPNHRMRFVKLPV